MRTRATATSQASNAVSTAGLSGRSKLRLRVDRLGARPQALRDDFIDVGAEAEAEMSRPHLDMLDVGAGVVDASFPSNDTVAARIDRDHRRAHGDFVADFN